MGSSASVADIDDRIQLAIMQGAWFSFSLSGGKDSTAASHAAIRKLDEAGHPRERRLAIHADLGRAEWRSTARTVEQIADRLGLPLLVVRRSAGDLVSRWEQRFESGRRRFEALSTYNLIGPWSQANKRFCTSEMKAQVIGPSLARRLRGEQIVSVIGLRRQESRARSTTPVSALDHRFAQPGNAAGTEMVTWYPVASWSTEQVLDHHRTHGLPLHEAYTSFGSSRLSCAFCVLASCHDLQAASVAPDNQELLLHLIELEARSTFSFQPTRWLADVIAEQLPAKLAQVVEGAKRDAAERRRLEASMPAGLRYVKGWPPRRPTIAEAMAIAGARAPILQRHGLTNIYGSGTAVIERFDELLALQRAKIG